MRTTWPDAADELAAGIDVSAFRRAVPRLWAQEAQGWWKAGRHAEAVARLLEARRLEEAWEAAGVPPRDERWDGRR